MEITRTLEGESAGPTAQGLAADPSTAKLAFALHDIEIEGYDLLEHIGGGGMGVVYKAHQRSLDRTVAIKILREDLAEDPSYIRRFHFEARAAASVVQ